MAKSDVEDPRPDIDAGTTHAPGRLGSVLRWNPKTGEHYLDQLVWGLLPHDTKDPANAPRPIMARAETLATHPLFASASRDRRAIVPMSVYSDQCQLPTIGLVPHNRSRVVGKDARHWRQIARPITVNHHAGPFADRLL